METELLWQEATQKYGKSVSKFRVLLLVLLRHLAEQGRAFGPPVLDQLEPLMCNSVESPKYESVFSDYLHLNVSGSAPSLLNLALARSDTRDGSFFEGYSIKKERLHSYLQGEADAEALKKRVTRAHEVSMDDQPAEPVTFWIDPGDASHEALVELFSAASDLHRALGGKGLVFERDDQEKPLTLSSV